MRLSKYIAPEGRCTVQYRVTSDNGITSVDDESAQRDTSDAIQEIDTAIDIDRGQISRVNIDIGYCN